ncbi:hypothetical protein I8H83_00955 [Candidatus Saccharibacteria bacterium]|nr:hypothetical protein [Candidatus Saccharibacteria bacterium]MBH2007155.1 hypothetical protein [Candidatus Saccharibacteria bacterium]
MTRLRTPGEIPPPQPDDYMRAIQMTIEAEHIRSGRDVLPVFRGYAGQNPEYAEYMNAALTIGGVIEPQDRTTGEFVDSHQKIAKAVVRGVVFGRLFVPRAHDTSVDLGKIVPVFPASINEIEDLAERNHAMGAFFVKTGMQGVDVMSEPAIEQLDSLSFEEAADFSTQRYFAVGCGVVAYAALRAHGMFNENGLRRDMSEGKFNGDWDDELARLLG